MVLNVTETVRLLREEVMEVGEEGDYLSLLSPPKGLLKLRWAAMRAILTFH